MEELERDRPLFDKEVPVLVQLHGKDERTVSLTIRVLTGLQVYFVATLSDAH